MKTVLISYDLNKVGKDYTDVIDYIKSLGNWANPLKSQWLVKTDLPTPDIIQGLQRHGADQDDSLLVLDVTQRPAAWSHLSPAVGTWLKTLL